MDVPVLFFSGYRSFLIDGSTKKLYFVEDDEEELCFASFSGGFLHLVALHVV